MSYWPSVGYHFKGYSEARKRIYLRDQGICCFCGKHTPWRDYDLEHRVPRAYGGGHHDSNLAVSHRSCNRRAGQRMRQPGVSGLPHSEGGRW